MLANVCTLLMPRLLNSSARVCTRVCICEALPRLRSDFDSLIWRIQCSSTSQSILYSPKIERWPPQKPELSCGCFCGYRLLDSCGTAYHFLFMIEELPTPFLNLRFQFRDHKDGLVYKGCQAAFVILFVVSRIVIGTGAHSLAHSLLAR